MKRGSDKHKQKSDEDELKNTRKGEVERKKDE